MNGMTISANSAAYLEICTQDFVGRSWVFQKINGWLVGETTRFFLLEGPPGIGKTTLAARLTEFSAGKEAPPPEAPSLHEGFLGAAHFCRAEDYHLISPYSFPGMLADQLIQRYPGYHQKLLETNQERPIDIDAYIEVKQIESGQVIGVNIEKLNLSRIPPQDAFEDLVRRPLKALLETGQVSQVIILVDGLDEALQYRQDIDIVRLISQTELLHPGVRFILTSGPVDSIKKDLRNSRTTRLSFDSDEAKACDAQDVRDYVCQRLAANNAVLTDRLARGGFAKEAFVTEVQALSENNFLYLRHLLDSIAAGAEEAAITPDTLSGMPARLSGIYTKALENLIGRDEAIWQKHYAAILGALAVAQEPLQEGMIANYAGLWPADVRFHLRQLRQLLNSSSRNTQTSGCSYALFHRSLADLLLRQNGGDRFWCDVVEQNGRIGNYYFTTYAGFWERCDGYGLRYTANHFAGAAEQARQPQRHELTTRLVKTVLDPSFQRAYKAQVGSLVGLHQELELAMQRTALNDTINPALALPDLIRAALAYVAFRENELKPEEIFALARQGEVDEARNRLTLFPIEDHWHRVAALLIVWLAAGTNPEGARTLLEAIERDLAANPDEHRAHRVVLQKLSARIRADLDNPAPTPPRLQHPHPPSIQLVQNVLDRMGGQQVKGNVEKKCTAWWKRAARQEPGEGVELSFDQGLVPTHITTDGHMLVAYAMANPSRGEAFFQDYLRIHATNNHRDYRNLAFWLLIDPVLTHPDPKWSCNTIQTFVNNVLTGLEQPFRGGLGVTLLALQAAVDQPGARAQLEATIAQTLIEASQLRDEPERHDAWGTCRRRLAALAEALTMVPDKSAEIEALLKKAYRLSGGYARYKALAYLTLAEATRVCDLDSGLTKEFLNYARYAAHNIQHGVFCARITARVNAICQRWWKSPAHLTDVSQAAEMLRQTPNAPRFAALHVIGEQYDDRHKKSPNMLPLPANLLQARTIMALAEAYDIPQAEFEQLNQDQGWAPGQKLDKGTAVWVPDSEFAAFIAARLAAEIVVTPDVPDEKRVLLIQGLVPAAARNPTTLDTVLARLLVAAYRSNPTSLLAEGLMPALEAAVHSQPTLAPVDS